MRKLKLFFACLLMAVLSIGQVWATDITFGWSQWDGVTGNFSGTEKDEVTQTVDGVVVTYTRNGSNLYANSTAIRFYGSNTLKFEAPANYTISSIEIAGSSFKNDVTTNVATCTSTTSALSWEGDASSVTFTRTGTSYITMTGATVTLKASTPAEKYTVSFNVGGSSASQADITEASAGAGITLPAGPTPTCSAAGWEFAGWAADAVASETTTAPTLLSGTYHPAANVTLYAVYKKTEAGGGSTTKSMTSFDAISGNVENDANVSYAAAQGTAGTAPAVNNNEIRIYQNGGLLTITANNGVKLNSITIGSSMVTKVTYAVDGGSASGNNDIAKNGTFTVDELDATEVVFTCMGTDKSSRLYLNNLSVTYSGGGTTYYLSAPSCAEPTCEDLGTPVVSVTNKTYNSAKLTWAAVANAAKYVVKFNGEDHEVTNNYYDATGLTPSTQYTYQVKALAAANQDDYCDSEFTTEANFTTEAAPKAHLTLMNLGEEHASSGDYAILTPFNLPTTAAACSKAFVGWDANPNCATAPTYVKGAEFTFANTTGVTLYAVYADAEAGDISYTKLTSDAFDAEATYIIAAAQTTSDATMWYLNSCANTDQNNGYGFMTTDPENNAPIQFQLSGTASALKIREVSGAKRYLKGLTTGNFQMSASEQTLTLSNAGAIGSSSNYILRHNYNSGNGGLRWYSSNTGTIAYLYKVEQEFTYSNYATTCVEAPEAIVDPEEVNAPAAGVANGVIVAAYDNVNESAVAVALYNNAACTEAFTGSWLTASINDDKNIAYTIAENTSYNDARTAYIKLTAPETTGATAPAVVVIPVSQAKKAAVFSSLEELVAADVNANTNVTVSFSNVVIKNIYYYNSNRRGLIFDIQKADEDIKIYFNADVPAEWVAGGKVSGTLTDCPWKIYSGAWQLAPASGFAWATDLSYTAPKTVSSVVVSGVPTKDTYVDGEKFNPAGLTVTVNYNDATSEVNPTGVTFACDPIRVAKSDNPVSVSVVATFNEVDSDPFEVTGLAVGDIQTKTIAEFIAAGNADMRCYLEGIVSDIETGTKLKYGNFNLTDASGTIYIYGCLDQNGDAEQFESLGVNNGDKIKVLAEDYEYYNSKNEAKNVQFVSKTPAATISIDDIDMETGDELALSSIVATITPAAAEGATITYVVTAGTAVSISEGKIIANAEGEATITASIAEGVGYLAANTTFTVTVTAPDTRKIATASAFTALSGDMSSTDISFAAYQGDATNAPVVRSGDNPVTIRMYKAASGKSTGGYLTLKAKVGCTIDQVKIEFSGNADAAYCKDAEALPTSKYITGQEELLTPTGLNAQSVSIVNLKNGSIDVAAITVWYNGDPLAVHHYVLGGTYATEFEQYGTFSYEGLTVTAAYDEQETITEPVSGFEVIADLSAAGAAKAEVYLGEDKLTEYDITVTPTAKLDPEIGWSPANNIVMTEGDEFTAPAWQNPHSVSVSFESTNTSVATVSNAGVITIKGLGSTTINATFAGDETYYSANPSITVTVNAAVEDLMGNWVVASSVAAGDRIIIANVAEGTAVKTMGAQNGNYRDEVASTVSNNIMTPADGTKVFTLIDASTIDANYTGFALRATNGKYLSAASSSSNNIKEVASVSDANAVWNIVISEGKAAIVAQGSYSRKVIRYNSSQPRFSCYAESNDMKDVVIYKRAFDYEREIAQGVLSTTCLPNGGVIYGASIFEVAYMDYEADGTTPHKIYFDEVEGGIMEAGVPYIVLANEGSDKFGVYYSDNENKAAQSKNGLVGYIGDGKYLAEDDYFIYNNMFYHVSAADANTRVHISNNRAYINLSGVPGYNNEPISVPAPGRRRVSLGNGAPKVATGIDALNASDKPVKMIIDGQLFILRGEKMYDVKGQLVK